VILFVSNLACMGLVLFVSDLEVVRPLLAMIFLLDAFEWLRP